MSTKCHLKRGLLVDKGVHEMSPKVSTRCHLFCPRDVTYNVHEMSATRSRVYKSRLAVNSAQKTLRIQDYYTEEGRDLNLYWYSKSYISSCIKRILTLWYTQMIVYALAYFDLKKYI